MNAMFSPIAPRAANGGRPRGVFARTVLAVFLTLAGTAGLRAADDTAWPEIKSEARPWAFWWWPASAVDAPNITHQLETFHEAGMGGIHIIPIYGAHGAESNYISYLSPEWMRMMGHTVSEAKRLGMGVDMTTGTGWCFGGPQVSDQDANAEVVVKTFTAKPGEKLTEKFDRKSTQALMAFPPDSGQESSPNAKAEKSAPNRPVDLLRSLSADGNVDWAPPAGSAAWTVYAISQKPSGQKVKRPAPGGEGWMLNLIYPKAMRDFLPRFSEAFEKYSGPKPRAQYHDSYEYRSDWAPDFFAQFEKRRGYKLQNELPVLFGDQQRASGVSPEEQKNSTGGTPAALSDHRARVLCDYRETVSDVMAEESLPEWVKWSHDHGFITRDQAHGSPGNLLDLYADADIPETEMFHSDRSVLVSKFASSAAHVTGKNLTSAETGTWLEEHFTEKLADLKYLADDMFLSGINHIFYHGTCYSPDGLPWPGWLFYASTEMNPRNSIWHDVRALNDYVGRCQAVLQSGKPDNDVLLYWPLHDYWSTAPGRLPLLKIHGPEWFDQQSIGRVAKELQSRGYSFDYVSDRQLQTGKVRDGAIQMPGGNYKVIVVPECNLMPLETFKQLCALADRGALVIFSGDLPKDIPGAGDLQKRQAAFQKLKERVRFKNEDTALGVLRMATVGKGSLMAGNVQPLLKFCGVSRESMADNNLRFIRRSFDGGWNYFIANGSGTNFDGWVTLSRFSKSIVCLNPANGASGSPAQNDVLVDEAGKAYADHLYPQKVRLQLAAGESLIVRAFADKKVTATAWKYWQPKDAPVEVTGNWTVKFISGGPVVPTDVEVKRLASWTTFSDAAQNFAGTAKYELRFDAPAGSKGRAFYLDLGNVCQSARVRLNGKDFGTLITPPFRIVAENLDDHDNVLEVEVTNVSANRVRDLDRRGVKWKVMRDINIVNINYKPFDASDWPLYDSGLLGPVTLTAVAPSN